LLRGRSEVANQMTPEFIRKRDAALKSVGEYWYLDFSTKEIRRKSQTGFAAVKQFFWKKRHTIWQLYVWLRHRQAEPDAMAYPDQISGDPTPLKGFPNKHELKGGWTIPTTDLPFLTHGPLASEGLTEILVPATNRWQQTIFFIKQAGIIVSALIAVAGSCVRWWSEISSLIS